MVKTNNAGSVTLELTELCNFNCKHCYLDKATKKDSLNIDGWKHIIDKWCDIGWNDFIFTGGEVLILDYFPDLYLYAARKDGSTISIQTNLSTLQDKYISIFKEYPPKDISVTLYGCDESTFKQFTNSNLSFSNIEHNIQLLISNNIKHSLGAVLCQSNYENILTHTFTKHDIGFNTYLMPNLDGRITHNERLSANQIVNVDKSYLKRKQYYKNKLDRNNDLCIPNPEHYTKKCQGGISRAFVDSTGQASICGIYRKRQIDVFNNDILYVLEYLHNIHHIIKKRYFESKCGKCYFTKICRACPAYFELDEDSDYFCEITKERAEQFS